MCRGFINLKGLRPNIHGFYDRNFIIIYILFIYILGLFYLLYLIKFNQIYTLNQTIPTYIEFKVLIIIL